MSKSPWMRNGLAVGNTIVLSRGLIDVVPDEETLAA
jgi:hypothetical protein